MSSAPIQEKLDQLRRQVDGFGRYRKCWLGLEGLGRFVLIGPGALLLWFLLDWAVKLPGWPLLISFVLAVAACIWSAPWWGLRPWLRRVRRAREARLIECLHGELDNLVIGALQLNEEWIEAEQRRTKLVHSPLLVQALLRRATEKLQALDLHALLDLRRAKKLVAAGAVVALVSGACLLFAADAVRGRWARLSQAYAMVLDTMFPVSIEVAPGNRAVVRHTAVALEVKVTGAHRDQVVLWRQEGQDTEAVRTVLTLTQGRAEFKVEDVAKTFTYRFSYGERRSETYTITAGDLPEIRAISYELAYPAYTGQPPRTITGRLPMLQGLGGTNVLVSLAATTNLHADGCWVEWQYGAKQPLLVNGRFAHFTFNITKPNRATIQLTGSLGPEFRMRKPLSFEVRVLQDRAPTVRIRMKRRKLTMLAEQATGFGFEFVAEDDFGIAETTLEYKIDTIDELLGRAPRESRIQRRIEPAQDRVRSKFEDIFKALNPPLAPGDRITVTVSARDNNTETGPRLGRSRPVEIVVVARDLADFAERHFAFGAHALLGGLRLVKRQTNLLIPPDKAVRTEVKRQVAKKNLKARISKESWPSGSEDAVGQYFQILSGAK